MSKLRTWVGVLLAAATMVLLSGCPQAPQPDSAGSQPSADTTASSPTEGGGQAAGMTNQWGPADGVPLGGYMSLTGPIATFGQSSNMAMGMAIEEINAAGGVLGGQKLKLVMEDSESKPEQSTVAAQRLIDVHHVVGVIGEVASSNSLAAAPVCQQAKVPMLSPSSTNPRVTKMGEYIFRACFTDDLQGAYMAICATQKGFKRAAILKDVSSDYSKGLTEVIQARFTQDGGEVVAVEGYQQNDPDFSATLTKLKPLNLDVIFVPGYYQDVGLILKQARELGLNTPMVGGDGWDSPVLADLAGKYLNQDCWFVNHYSKDEDRPKVRQFVDGFKQRYGSDPDALAACAYDAVYVVAEALERAGAADPVKLREALATTRDFDGVTGTITIDADRNASKPCVVLGFQDGKQVVVGRLTPDQV